MRVLKYVWEDTTEPLELVGENIVEICSIEEQYNKAVVYATVEDSIPPEVCDGFVLEAFATGEEFETDGSYWGTVKLNGGSKVIHVFLEYVSDEDYCDCEDDCDCEDCCEGCCGCGCADDGYGFSQQDAPYSSFEEFLKANMYEDDLPFGKENDDYSFGDNFGSFPEDDELEDESVDSTNDDIEQIRDFLRGLGVDVKVVTKQGVDKAVEKGKPIAKQTLSTLEQTITKLIDELNK